MVAHYWLRTQELLYEEIDNIMAEILSAWQKAECYEEVANHSKCIFTSILWYAWWNEQPSNLKTMIQTNLVFM